ncbi:MAG: toll/interleukin-1 receptor domain-containing protein [Acidobacteria bacterium]|nr:toll/interleukin-1 receptor domain-containing protein [Acidobacteriota bacterium]
MIALGPEHSGEIIHFSYPRRTASAQAAAELCQKLGPETAFFDTSDIADGDPFPPALAAAVLEARVVVVFAEPVYFQRWWCRQELRLAQAPLYAGGPADLRHVVVALAPEVEGRKTDTSYLPPGLRTANLPAPGDTERLAKLVSERLAEFPQSLRQRLSDEKAKLLAAALESDAAIPLPQRLEGIRTWHPAGQLPASLRERFVGRAQDLYRIDQTLDAIEHGAAAISGQVSAAGGFGKTRLALEYIWRYAKRRFHGGVFWLDADQDAPGIEQQHHAIWTALVGEQAVPPLNALRQQGRPVAPLLGQALEEAAKHGRVLMVDNVPEASPARPLTDYCPSLGSVTLLATSRQQTADRTVKALPIGTLPRVASVLLLTHELKRAAWTWPVGRPSRRRWGICRWRSIC